MDDAYKLTDEILGQLEKYIKEVYVDASNDMQKTIDDYFARFEKRDAEQRRLLEAGEITDSDYQQWRMTQIGRGQRYEAMSDKLAERANDAARVAMAYTNDTTPQIYALNYNFAAYEIEKLGYSITSGANMGGVSFTLMNEQTVKRLLIDKPNLLPQKVVNGEKLDRWSRDIVSRQILSSTLQGKTLKQTAEDLARALPDMTYKDAVRNARTAVTGSQNAGRQASYERMKEMGIEVEKQWISTLDSRTRETHRMLDGETIPVEDTFWNGCEYPGDERAEPAEVYNCRCSLKAVFPKYSKNSGRQRIMRDENGRNVYGTDYTYTGKNGTKSYRDWIKEKTGGSDAQGLNISRESSIIKDEKLIEFLGKYPNADERYYYANEYLKSLGIKRGIMLPPQKHNVYLLPTNDSAPYHAMQRMLERNISSEDLVGYMENADVMFAQWNGERLAYYGKDGVCVITKTQDGDWLYKTAWDKSDFDDETNTILKVIKRYGLSQ